MARGGFIFGGDTGETQGSLRRQREIVRSMMANQRVPRDVGEGIAAIGQALSARMWNNYINKQEAAGRESAAAAFNPIVSALGRGGDFPPSPSALGASASAEPYTGPKGDFDTRARDVATRLAKDLNISPEQAAGIVGQLGHESEGLQAINERNPVVPGSRGGFGWAQWTGPRRKAFEAWAGDKGLDVTSDEANYGFLLHELQNTPEGRVLDSVRNSPDALSAGRAFTDGFLRPGIPGYASRDQWTNRALTALNAAAPAGGSQPVQVASLDPSAGVAAALDAQGGAPLPPSQIPIPAQGFGQANVPMAQSSAMPTPAPAPVQVAQAQPMPEMAGNTTDRRSGNIDLGTLIQAAQNPWLSETQSSIIQALMRQEMTRNDPVAQMEQEKLQLELERMRNPAPEEYSLSPGEIRFRGDKEIARGGPKEPDLPSAVREYEYAKSQGFPGTFQDWEASKKGGMSLQVDPATGAVTFQQGNNIKPLTEAQSKDTVFATRAEGALPLIDQHGDALTRFGEGTLGGVPVIGNYLKSPEYQQAEQAGKEFLQAILRKDTGAAITPQETEEYGSVYLPRPGDSAEVKEQKRLSRSRALNAIKAGMPAQAILNQEKALLETGDKGAPAAADGAPKPGDVMEGYRFKGGDPADQNSWEKVQ